MTTSSSINEKPLFLAVCCGRQDLVMSFIIEASTYKPSFPGPLRTLEKAAFIPILQGSRAIWLVLRQIPPFSVEQNKDCECCKTPSRRPSAQFFMKNKHKPAGAKIMRFSAKASSSGLGNSWTPNSTEENEENEAPTLSSFPSCSFVKPPFLLSLHHFPG